MRQRSLPGLGATAHLVAMSLLVTAVLVMTLVLGQLVSRPRRRRRRPRGR